jgi:7,8-dihydropterin-6-yl-methyl-4-(beta-D-ribofuranosyl)aminobenzene 5'-phosphate synthase
MNEHIARKLLPADALEIQVLVDNVTDSLSTVPEGVVQENTVLRQNGMTVMSGEAKCCANHGLSLVISARIGGASLILLFDAGPEAYAVARNGERLGVPFGEVGAIVLSHGHWDHAGGMLEAVRRVSASNGGKPVPCHVNPGMFVTRGSTIPEGGYQPAKDIPSPGELT